MLIARVDHALLVQFLASKLPSASKRAIGLPSRALLYIFSIKGRVAADSCRTRSTPRIVPYTNAKSINKSLHAATVRQLLCTPRGRMLAFQK